MWSGVEMIESVKKREKRRTRGEDPSASPQPLHFFSIFS
jgi:hypothetical protein